MPWKIDNCIAGDILYASDEMSRVMDTYREVVLLGQPTRYTGTQN